MGYYLYHPDVNGGFPINCNLCSEPVHKGDAVYFINMDPLTVQHAHCTWEKAEAEAKTGEAAKK